MSIALGFTAVTGATYTAAQYNTNTRDNLAAIWVGSAAGDIDYYSSATTKARLAKPSVDSVLTNNSSGTLAWLAKAALGGLHAKAAVYHDVGGGNFGTGWVDLSGVNLSIVISVTCTLIVLAFVEAACAVTGNGCQIRASVGGTDDPNSPYPETNLGTFTTLPYIGYFAGITAGTIACKMEAWADGAGGLASNSRMIVLAFPE